ncbi:MAG: hypothetical protein Q8912_02255 [Bacillota bacterium]|nr:hypothetical protein [Bacillota bacterium]
MSEHEEILMCKTSFILGKDTSQMKLNDIIEELVKVIEDNYQNQWLRNWEKIVTPPSF